VIGFDKSANRVLRVLTNRGDVTCDETILAPGSWLPNVAKLMGVKLLLQPGKGYSYTYDHVENNIQYPAILVDGRCALTPWGKQLRIGGTMELSGINNKILEKRMDGIYESVKNFYPGLKLDAPKLNKIW